MLPKSYRLYKDKDIARAYRTKFQTRTDFLKLYLNQTESTGFQSLIVISKKVFKKANKRNRLRRRIYGLLDELKVTKRLPPQISVIVQIQNKNLLSLQSLEFKKEILDPLSGLYSKMMHKLTAGKSQPRMPK